MEKEKNVAEVVPEETVVNESEVTTPAQEEVTEEVASTQEVKPEVKDNRPVENVAWEVKRKLDETIPTLQNEIRELKTYIQEGRQQTPTYTKAQLQAFSFDPNTSTQERLWALTEVEKLEKAERAKEYETLVTSTQRKTESEVRRNQSAQWVSQTFPDTVVKDPMGNVMGWNNQSPVLARANEYMNRSETLRNDPEGFMAAVKMAAFDLGVTPTSNKKVDRTVAQLRKEQKKQLASSGGTRIVETSEVAKKNRMERLKEEYAKTGNKKIFEEMVKIRGLNPYI
jgi:hypothetical protein